MTDYIIEGRVLLITDSEGQLIADIDTDQIFHNAHLHITDINEMGRYAFGNLEGWEDFPKIVQPGDMVVAGKNFGSGSSRQQAVDCFKSLGIRLIIAESFGAIYKRNAINSGFPILMADNISHLIAQKQITHLQNMKIDLLSGEWQNLDTGASFALNPFSRVQKDIYDKGSLLSI
jgi:3-isopropylmalate dehydratase small subunit